MGLIRAYPTYPLVALCRGPLSAARLQRVGLGRLGVGRRRRCSVGCACLGSSDEGEGASASA
eukprot:3771367-Prorocentrum_lima.AAC.1